MGWWTDEYFLAARDLGDVNPLYLAIAAVFDRVRVPAGLRGKLEVFVGGPVVDGIDVVTFLDVTLGSAAYVKSGRDRYRRGVPRVMVDGVFSRDPVFEPSTTADGTPCFAVVYEAKDFAPKRYLRFAKVRTASVDVSVVLEFAGLWYGVDLDGVHVPEKLHVAELTVGDLAVAAETCGDVVRFLGALADDMRPPKEEPEPAAPEGKPAPRKTPKLSEMAGFGEARSWGLQLAADLRAYQKGELAWDDVDKGILVSGPPGCGKTTFAKALAAEVDAHFEAVTYASFDVSSGVSKHMKKKFDEWRKKGKDGPVVVFWDELDTMGVRGKNAHNDSFWTAVINTVLDFLDGVESRDGVVFIGATNFTDRIDPALMRPGRLDRHVELPKPSVDELQDVVAYHLGVDAKAPATRAAAIALRGKSPADVALWARDTRRMGRLLKRKVDGQDLADLVEFQRPKPSPALDRLVRVHESGHAVAALALEREARLTLHSVDVDADDANHGCVVVKPITSVPTRTQVLRTMAYMLAGRAAEERVIGEVTTGSERDLLHATFAATKLVRQQGLDGTLIFFEGGTPVVPEEVARVEAVLQEAYAISLHMVRGTAVEALAEILRTRRYMTGTEVREAMARHTVERFFAARRWEEEEEEYLRAA